MYGGSMDDIIDPFAEEPVAWSGLSLSNNQNSKYAQKDNSEEQKSKVDYQEESSQEEILNVQDSIQNIEITADIKKATLELESDRIFDNESLNTFNSKKTSVLDNDFTTPLKEVNVDASKENPAQENDETIKKTPMSPKESKNSKPVNRPILFKRNLNKTHVLLSNSKSDQKSDFIDPLTSASQSLKATDSPVIDSDRSPVTQSSIYSSPKKTHFSQFNDPDSKSNSHQMKGISDKQSSPSNFLNYEDSIIQPDIYESTPEEPKIVTLVIDSDEEYLNESSNSTDSNIFSETDFVVRRRYRDFEWLYSQLQVENPGIIIPPIPEKQSFGRFEQDFVENRRIGLQTFLDRTATHPVLHKNKSFILFLESKDFIQQSKI
ncbi:Vacuolar protein sorting-associated protein 5 [Smittium mucronatum]|uniref:Vacuolar protein sorting-associated protein 5 n=1 Tax=Smittium mucronatum TaxID=133383 RepID=A0A1R0GP91_9FUNG|nr:Vacuolar protein sorting-associated protein 5 [Smittium mucronatum]